MQKRPTFSKRQKEQARREKQRVKAERRQQRKAEKALSGAATSDIAEPIAEAADLEGTDDVADKPE